MIEPVPTSKPIPEPSPEHEALRPRRQRDAERIGRLAHLLDSQFRLPGTRWRFGLDGLAGLIPGVGDVVTALPLLYFLHTARRHGAGKRLQLRLVGNTLLDLIIGAIPLLGDLFDFGFKGHQRNARLLRRLLDESASTRDDR